MTPTTTISYREPSTIRGEAQIERHTVCGGLINEYRPVT